ncbi:glycoside hydrolase family 3 C-terminal domain-containing protein [Streptomyces hygroscopicus subsp. hygroscopicus]|uniref:Beta-glucosidase n=1 Tax=Streptomyces demainii TaxID=588122 RepID=A0ABT9KS32_9ACTN|nr:MULTISPECIES: glycoside hydrolase family 3 C-terminal domain-containing protein [Streptomyces]MBW8091476.1 glycoside hydrolase family 3 C-terminal domain-containing protein [Streptomyces hygroscopicus subsp. hygroscopicus]MDP9610327.1 beta-glucosidase [Streptomyces demainii]
MAHAIGDDGRARGDGAAEAVEKALGLLDLDTKARLLSGQDMWSLPAVPAIGLRSLVMSDGPIGVRGVHWTADDPSVALPSPTALAATWDPELARRAGRLLAQEARRKGVHVLLAPTVNLHRSPLGGRHFEAYSEDPYLTGAIGTGYVTGVQEGGVGTTVKHFVANDAETERFTVDNEVGARALRELYLAPFETIVKNARPWGVMAAYNGVNGSTMTEHRWLQQGVLRGEWGFDGFIVSDWMAARDTVRALKGGLDVAMPGPRTVYGEALAAAVREGRVTEAELDGAVRRLLTLAARVGALDGAAPAVAPADRPGPIDGDALAREIARRSFVLLRNEAAGGRGAVLPLGTGGPGGVRSLALIGAAARDARVLGGGSAVVFPDHVVSPLDGLRAALPPDVALSYAVGADPTDELAPAARGFELRAVVRAADGRVLGESRLPSGQVQWIGDFPAGVSYEELHTVETVGTFTPRESGAHTFGTRGLGGLRLVVDGQVLFEGEQLPAAVDDPFEAFLGSPVPRGQVRLTAGVPVEVSLSCAVARPEEALLDAVCFSLMHRAPERDAEELLQEAVAVASAADAAVVVVATTERVESEGFDRRHLRLPGRQDELVRRVAATGTPTVVVVNAGSPVEMDWREEVAAVLLSWFPGQEAGAALADVLLGAEEPGGRLPTTWPARLADAPVREVTPSGGRLVYEEGLFIGYRAWERRQGAAPAYWFGHGLGYTDWAYEAVRFTPARAVGGRGAGEDDEALGTVTVRVRNTGARAGREVVQIYLTVPEDDGEGRPVRRLAGFAPVTAGPGETAEASITLPRRAAEVWDEERNAWRLVPGGYTAEAGRSVADRRISVPVPVAAPTR